ncbi:MAG: hypothetical protein NC402_00235 [Prevotella sp.]|nr:hypothetical protein [Prevotella sp.]MCM1074437.1 hypothetical protein [Ruminococcus sp.]
MAYRNGIVADTLRAAGMDCYNVIFGLNVPQLAHIAGTLVPGMTLADALWADRKVRESRLLAAYLFPPEEVSEQKALELMADVQTQEEADMLAFRLLRQLPYHPALKAAASGYAATALSRY